MLDRLKGLSFAIVRRTLLWMTHPSALGSETLPPHLRVVYVLNSRSLTDLVMLDIVTQANNLPRPREALTDQGIPERHRFFFLNRPTGFLIRRNLMRTYSKRMLRLQTVFSRHPQSRHQPGAGIGLLESRAEQRAFGHPRAVVGGLDRNVALPALRHDPVQPSRHHRSVRRADRAARSGRAADQRRSPRATDCQARARRNSKNNAPPCSARIFLIAVRLIDQTHRESQRARRDRRRGGKRKSIGRRLARRARRYARAMASDMSYITIRLLQRLLTWFWNRIYDGIDVARHRTHQSCSPKLRRSSTCRAIAVTSTTWCFRTCSTTRGLMIPHVAAGDNLNMPFVGPLLRRGARSSCGAASRDDRLYSAVFSEYLYQLVRRGSPSEYFIEGGRSRTGRLLPPRTGLLNMTIATHVAWRTAADRLRARQHRLRKTDRSDRATSMSCAAGSKQRESIRDVLRSLRLIRQAFGRVHVSFGNALSLGRVPCDNPGDRPAGRA